jgi:hypothetical protein
MTQPNELPKKKGTEPIFTGDETAPSDSYIAAKTDRCDSICLGKVK